MTIAQKTLSLIEPIPADQFIVTNYTNGVDKCDVLGHLTRLTSDNPADYSKQNCSGKPIASGELELRRESRKFLSGMSFGTADIAYVNKAPVLNPYTEDGIKDRVVHLLNDMIAAGY